MLRLAVSLCLAIVATGIGHTDGTMCFSPSMKLPQKLLIGSAGVCNWHGKQRTVGPHRSGCRRTCPTMMATAGIRKQVALREQDPEELRIVERQRVLTDAMNLLQKWDEEQMEFVLSTGDRNAPLGDWRGLRRRLTAAERIEMQKACKVLAEDARYVCIGLNGESEAIIIKAMNEWLTGLGLPVPPVIILTDDAQGYECESKDDLPPEVLELYKGPMHIGYNSKAGADPATGDDSLAPPAAHMMPYPAPDRGVVFTPILDGFFTQYGDVPLDLFAPEDEADIALESEVRDKMIKIQEEEEDDEMQGDEDIALRQHASLGNVEAVKELQRKEAEKRKQEKASEQDESSE